MNSWTKADLNLLEQIKPISDWKQLSKEEQAKHIDYVYRIYQEKEFPFYIDEPEKTGETSENILQKVRKCSIKIENNSIISNGHAGTHFCSRYHKHKYEASYRGHASLMRAYYDPENLKKAIAYQFKCGDPLTPNRVKNALSATNKAPYNFAPVVSRWLVDTYGKEEGIVFDPCAGYGGRLLGSLASHKNVSYIGFDPEIRTTDANKEMAIALNTKSRTRFDYYAVEDNIEWPTSDLIITGPPYYDTESYGDLSDALVKQYTTYDNWLNGFMKTLITKAMASAPLCVINVGTFQTSARKQQDLPVDTIDLITSLNFNIKEVYTWETKAFYRKKTDATKLTKRHIEKLIVLSRNG